MFKISEKLKHLIILLAILIFYSISAYGIWSVVLIPNVIKEQLSPVQLSEIYTMYSICVILTIGLGILTYMLVTTYTGGVVGGKKYRVTHISASALILTVILIIVLIACIASYYYLANITAPLSPG